MRFTITRHVVALAILVIGAAQSAQAQTTNGPEPGYLINLRGDTVQGFVTIPTFVSERGVTFQPRGRAPRQYMPSEALGFGVKDGPVFVTHRLMQARRAYLNTRLITDRKDTLAVFAQQLVSGYMRFYRFDYHLSANDQGTALDLGQSGTRTGTRFYLLDHPNSRLLMLQQRSYRALLAYSLADCPAAIQTLESTKLTEESLVALTLRYNACHPEVPTVDRRPPPDTTQKLVTRLSLRAGVLTSHLSYSKDTESGQFAKDKGTGTTGSVMVRFNFRGKGSFLTGLQFIETSGAIVKNYRVPTGYLNAGEQLALRHEVRVRNLHLPLLGQYMFTTSRLRPYVIGGFMLGFTLSNRTALDQPAFVSQPGNPGEPIQAYQVAQTEVLDKNTTGPTAGFSAGLGLSPKLGRISPLLEAYYEQGSQMRQLRELGRLHYRSTGVRLGLEF